jgi:hypothetical protein
MMSPQAISLLGSLDKRIAEHVDGHNHMPVFADMV